MEIVAGMGEALEELLRKRRCAPLLLFMSRPPGRSSAVAGGHACRAAGAVEPRGAGQLGGPCGSFAG
jgi:hypothetical protein